MLPPMRMGSMTRLARNALVRTEARYSRRAITSTLRMVVVPRVGSGDANEDVLQRGTSQLEMAHLSTSHEGGQDLLGIGVAIEAQFLQTAEIRDADDAGQAVQCRVGAF